MEHSRVALPESSYLERIGEVAFTVSSMEWMILGDLHRLADGLSESLTIDQLEPTTTAGIAKMIKAAIEDMGDGPIKEYLVVAYRALFAASTIRNDLLHARPATHPDGPQRLSRSETVNQQTTGARFWIDNAWFDHAIAQLNGWISAMNARRPLLI